MGIGPNTHEGIFASTSNEGEAFPHFILVTCHFALEEKRVDVTINLLISL